MFLIRLAIKNLKRHKKRTLLTAAVIAVAVFFYIFYDSLMIGMRDKSFENIINFESAHMQIANDNYWDKREEFPLEDLMFNSKDILNEISSIENYKAASPQLKFMARINNGIDELPVPVRGVIAEREKEVFNTGDYFVKGNFFNNKENKAVMGEKLASIMNLDKGDYFTLVFRTKENTFNTVELEVDGLLKTPNPNINSNRVYIPLPLAQKILNLEDKITQIAIRLENKNNLENKLSNINNKLDNNISAYSWRESASSMINISQVQKLENRIILSIILIIATLGIVNTIILAGIERIEEIGMMKALGLKEREIILSFVYESTGIAIIGGLIGSFLAFLAVAFFHNYGINFFTIMGDNIDLNSYGMPISGTVYGGWNLSTFIFIFFFVTIISSIISIFPAIWAARKDVVKSIHHRK